MYIAALGQLHFQGRTGYLGKKLQALNPVNRVCGSFEYSRTGSLQTGNKLSP